MLRVCIASIENIERSLLLLVVSVSELRTIKFFSVFFSSVYWSMLLHAGSHKQTVDGASPTVRSTLHGRR